MCGACVCYGWDMCSFFFSQYRIYFVETFLGVTFVLFFLFSTQIQGKVFLVFLPKSVQKFDYCLMVCVYCCVLF